MPRIFVLLSVVWLLLTTGGCTRSPGRWWDGVHYPFSCPRCPHYDYDHGNWKPFRFGVLTGPDIINESAEIAPQGDLTAGPSHENMRPLSVGPAGEIPLALGPPSAP